MSEKPFFIGWESEADPRIRKSVKKQTVGLIILGLVLAVLVTAMQRTPSKGTFDFGNVQEFTGVLFKEPVPTLVSEDGKTYYLVRTLKNGFPADVAERHHLQTVTVKATLIEDDLESMLEVVDDGVVQVSDGKGTPMPVTELGEVILQGEIVDSKCHLGVMNPGRFKPHRACAIQCLSGGIPPILVVQTSEGTLAHYLLVMEDGSAANEAVLDYAAEPVELSGNLKKIGDRQVLYLNTGSIKRL